MQQNNSRKTIITPIIMALVLIAGIIIGASLKKSKDSNSFLIYPRADKISNIFDYIQEEYVDSVSQQTLVEAAIPAVLKQLDPHSIYIPASELQQVNEPLEGNFSGIGIEFNMPDDTVVIVNTIPNGPSEQVGLLPGDRIVRVDDSLVAGIGLQTDKIIKKLKGKQGTKVMVGIHRPGKSPMMEFEITRDKIPLYSVDVAYMATHDIGYIKINQFARTTYEEFTEAVVKLKKLGMKKILVDLRGNGGGYMDAATKIADHFLEKGKLIVYTQGRSKPRQDFIASSDGLVEDEPAMILIDEWSASASEILAGAIQDNDRGTIVGRRSFGKGLVQEQISFADGSAMRLTVARYYTPTGRSIQKPYSKGFENYYEDLHKRYEHGEFIVADSIHFADSLKYTTPGGKIVYGGGGIMPDIFIPADTSGGSDLIMRLRSKNLIYLFAFNFTDKNRQMLQKFKNYRELTKYLDDKDIMNDFYNYAASNGVKSDAKGVKASGKIIQTQVYAYIVRNIFDNEGYFPVIQEIDETLKSALKIFENSSVALKK